MLEVNKEQLLSFNEVNRARILKMIAQGLIKYKKEDYILGNMIEENINHIPYLY